MSRSISLQTPYCRIVASVSQLTWQPNLTPGKLLIKEATTVLLWRQKDFLFLACVNTVFKSTSVRTVPPKQEQLTCFCYHKSCRLPANICYDELYVGWEWFTCERVGSSLSPVLQFDIRNGVFALLGALELFFLRLGLQGFYTKLQLACVLLMLYKETGGKQDVRNLLPTIRC